MKKINSIMLIDDDTVTNFYHKIIVQRSGCCNQIQVFEDATEALAHLKETRELPDIIFLDINMPKMNGWEFIEGILKNGVDEKLGDTIIVMLTTSVNPKDKEKSLKYEIVSNFKHKPLTDEILEEVIGAL